VSKENNIPEEQGEFVEDGEIFIKEDLDKTETIGS